MRKIICLVLFGLMACEDSGTCASANAAVIDICYEGWTAPECEEYDKNGTNGGDWTFYASETCETLGFTKYCEEYDSYVYDNESC